MMTHPEISLYMNYVVNLAKRNMLKDGYAFPIVVSFVKGEDRKPELVHDLVVTKARYVMRDLRVVDEEEDAFNPDPTNPEETVYAYLYLLRFDRVEDEDHLEFITKMIARTGNPDAIGYLCSCVYNVYDDVDNVRRDHVLRDPEASRILYASYFRNDDPQRRDLVCPFINRGEIKEDPFSYDENEVERHEVLAAHSGWFIPTPQDARKMKNPYNYK
jgi:hypothetical protein